MSDSSRRDIELRIRAQDLSTASFQSVATALKDLTTTIYSQLDAARKGAVSNAELRESIVKLEQAGKALTSIAGLIDSFKNLSGVVAANQANLTKAAENLAAYRTALETTANTSKAAETKLAGLVSSFEKTEAALTRNQANLAQMGAALGKAGIDVNNLEVAERELKATADLVGPALGRLNEAHLTNARVTRSAKEEGIRLREEQQKQTATLKQQKADQDKATESLAKFNEETKRLSAQKRADAAATVREQVNAVHTPTAVAATVPATSGSAAGALNAGNATLFGLRPYELQNLSYQINDIISGFISGQKATQIAAQQGGQVLQIFNRNLLDLIKYLPLVTVGATLATVAISALNAGFRDIATAREFNALLKLNADGSRYSSEAFVKLSHDIHALGIDFDDVNKILRQALQTGLNQDRIKEFAAAARGLKDLFPDKFPNVADAFKSLTEDLGQGVEGIRKFNAQFHILTDTELAGLNTQKDVAGAIQLITTRLTEQGARTLSPTTKAFRDLSIAWGQFTTALSETSAFQKAIDAIGGLLTSTTKLIENLKSLPENTGNFIDSVKNLSDSIVETLKRNNPALKSFFDALKGDSASNAPLTLSGGRYSAPRGSAFEGADALLQPPFTTKGLKIDTDELRAAVAVLSEAAVKAGLPAGYRVEAISTERPGAVVAGKGTPSEHAGGRAIDVRIVDSNGVPIAGSMGTEGAKVDSTGLYGKLDAAFEQAIKRQFPGTGYAVGTRFDKSDPGHYSIGGSEAANQAAKESRPAFTPTADQVKNSALLVQNAERELKIKYDIVEAATRQAVEEDARLKAQKETPVVADQERLIKIKVEEFDAGRREREIEFQHQISALRVSDGKNAEVIAKAGLDARAKALADAQIDVATGTKLITLEQLRKAEIQGQEEARKRYNQDEKRASEDRQLLNQFAQLNRTNELKDTTSLETRLKGVADQYSNIRRTLEKRATDFPGTTSPVTTAQVDTAEAAAKQNETAKFYLDRLNSLESQRKDLVAAQNAAVAAGATTISDAEDKIREAFTKTTPEINQTADAFKAFLATADQLDPTKIELYTAKLKTFKAESQYISPLFKDIKTAVETSFSTGLVTAFNTVGEAIGKVVAGTGKWKDVFTAVKKAAADFFAGLLKDIAAAIIKYEALKLISGATGGGGGIGGLFGSLFGGGTNIVAGTGAGAGINTNLLTGATSDVAGSGVAASFFPIFHSGGVVGQPAPSRAVAASWFANAPRYHAGSVIGLRSDEQAAILQRGEEILARDSPRNIMRGGGRSETGGSGSGSLNIRNVLVFDETQIPTAMAGAHGEQVTLSHIVKNAATVRQLLK